MPTHVIGIFLGGEKQRVVIDLSATVRERIEARQWHRTQKCQRLPDGGVRLSFEAANLTQVVRWVHGWSVHGRVREPATLVEQVAGILREGAKRYE